ncbi:class I adenylate-forming enzyme family protein [Knoellia sp. CPCC 206453]|uniref:class I adenylate-forming enzyme family protein n=1 Tax=Knoellia pratensis TaxID=3404796 RepID=UPI00360CE33E
MRDTPARAALRQMGFLREADGRSWLELSTSGTAAAPRTVRRSLASWERSFDHVSRLTRTVASDVVLVPAPPSGSMFAFAHAHAAHVGAEVVALDRWSLRDAEAALASCTIAHVTPAMLTGLLDRDLGRLRTVVCAGAALPRSVRERAQDAGVEVVDYYGAAELSFVAMRVGARLDPFPEVEVDLRGGVIWARSPWLADGYAHGQTVPLVSDADGWATVGDRGCFHDELGLVVLGRGDESVTTGGATVLCADVEAAVLAFPAVTAAVAIGTPHAALGEVLEVVVTGAFADGFDELRSHTAELVSRTHIPRRWHVWSELPLTPAGKVDRAEVRRRLAADRALEASP